MPAQETQPQVGEDQVADASREHRPRWGYTLRKAGTEFGRDEGTFLAAGLTYYSILSIFPALVALVSLVGVFGRQGQSAQTILQTLRDMGQNGAADTLTDPITQMTQSTGAGIALVLGLVGALWSASGYVGAFGKMMNRVYDVPEGRGFFRLRPVQLLLTLVCILGALLVVVGLAVSGPVARTLGDKLGLGEAAVTAWNIAKWPVILVIVIMLVAMLYHFTPNVRRPKFRLLSPGAVIAIVVWILASVAFAFYVANFSKYNKTYGALAGVIVFLLWIWLTNVALVFGAEVDAEAERSRQLQAGLPAESELQLPMVSTKKSDKALRRHERHVARGREIRQEAVASGAVAGAGATGMAGTVPPWDAAEDARGPRDRGAAAGSDEAAGADRDGSRGADASGQETAAGAAGASRGSATRKPPSLIDRWGDDEPDEDDVRSPFPAEGTRAREGSRRADGSDDAGARSERADESVGGDVAAGNVAAGDVADGATRPLSSDGSTRPLPARGDTRPMDSDGAASD